MTLLPFDPIERAGELWQQHYGESRPMQTATSIMRVQQLLSSTLDAHLRPFGITFARYEVLVLLKFSRSGELSLSKVGERLMVHPASVTNAIARLSADGLVTTRTDPQDRRRSLARLTPQGSQVLQSATDVLQDIEFGLGSLSMQENEKLIDELRRIRLNFGDFPD